MHFLREFCAFQLNHLNIYQELKRSLRTSVLSFPRGLSLKYLFVKSLTHIFFGKIIAKAWLKIYCIADVGLSSNNLEFDQNIFAQALFELNKEVESLSGKSIKYFGFTLH